MAEYPPVRVTTCCDPEQGKAKEDIFELPFVPDLVTGPHHIPEGVSPATVTLLSARDYVEQRTYRAALSSAQAPDWQAAMQHEHSSLMDNGTWELVDLLPGRVVVNIMWIYKIKYDTLGDVSRFKAIFVAKGCSQRVGLDFTETFSPVIRMASLRLFLAIAVTRDLNSTSTLRSSTPPSRRACTSASPLGFSHGTSKVCHLKRCLYGLKQSPREFDMQLRA
jgi:hypothetical protein